MLALWPCNLCSHTGPHAWGGPMLGSVLCYRHLEILILFEEGPCISLYLGPPKLHVSPSRIWLFSCSSIILFKNSKRHQHQGRRMRLAGRGEIPWGPSSLGKSVPPRASVDTLPGQWEMPCVVLSLEQSQSGSITDEQMLLDHSAKPECW